MTHTEAMPWPRSAPAAVPAGPPGERVVLTDGTAALIRPLGPADREAVARLHSELPADDLRHRFLAGRGPAPAVVADSIIADDVTASGVFWRGRLVGVGHYIAEPGGGCAELALAVAHDAQHLGVGTLLTEDLVAHARQRGVRVLTAEVASDNIDVLHVLGGLGLPITRAMDGPETSVRLLLGEPPVDPNGFTTAHLSRTERSEAQGLRPILAPRSVAVIGASRHQRSVGHALLTRIRRAGFTGELVAVNPHGTPDRDVPWVPSTNALGRSVDLAVVCVPADAVPEVAEECGRAGVRAMLVITAGITGAPAARLREALTRYGMRLIGPNCLGLANTDPDVRLDALFAGTATPGVVGVGAQSGGVAVGLLADLARLGLGTSSVVCAGDGLDIGADDLLAWWAQDGRTRAAVLYLESVSRPHTFADLARRVGQHLPVVAIRSGSSAAGRRAAASHTASTATPRAVRDALLRSAGILTVDTPSRAAEALAALCWQPLPTGPRIAVVSNTGGAGVLAADACVRAGLTVATLSAETRSALSHLLPATAALAGPVDTTATVSPMVFACVLDVVAADTGVDAVVAIGAATDLADPLESVCGAGDGPLLAVRLGQAEGVAVLHPNSRPVPCYADPDAAAAALALALKRAHRLARTCVPVAPDKVDPARARAVIDAALDARPDGGWLDPAEEDELLRAAGIQTAEVQVVRDAEAAVARWRAVGGPVVLKAHADGLLHKSRAGGVLVGRNTETAVREAVAILAERFGERLRGVVVQPMVDHGAELLVGVTGDAVFGPLLTVGLGGTSTDLVADRSHVLVPTTEADVDEALDELHSAARLFGPGGPDRATVCDVALRMGWLAALLPEIAEAEINPLVAIAHSVLAVDARIRLAPQAARSGPDQ